jgi:hypothetical protein
MCSRTSWRLSLGESQSSGNAACCSNGWI